MVSCTIFIFVFQKYQLLSLTKDLAYLSGPFRKSLTNKISQKWWVLVSQVLSQVAKLNISMNHPFWKHNFPAYFSHACWFLWDIVDNVERDNHSVVSEFIFLGLSKSQNLQILLLLGFSAFYIGIVFGNLLILVTVTFDSCLHTPMYFLLINLSCIDMLLASFATLKMTADFLREQKTISWWGCYSQMFFMHLLGGSEMM